MTQAHRTLKLKSLENYDFAELCPFSTPPIFCIFIYILHINVSSNKSSRRRGYCEVLRYKVSCMIRVDHGGNAVALQLFIPFTLNENSLYMVLNYSRVFLFIQLHYLFLSLKAQPVPLLHHQRGPNTRSLPAYQQEVQIYQPQNPLQTIGLCKFYFNISIVQVLTPFYFKYFSDLCWV